MNALGFNEIDQRVIQRSQISGVLVGFIYGQQ